MGDQDEYPKAKEKGNVSFAKDYYRVLDETLNPFDTHLRSRSLSVE